MGTRRIVEYCGETNSGRILYRFIHQKDRNVVTHWVDAMALGALETFARLLLHQRFLAYRAYQNVEKVLGNHADIVRRGQYTFHAYRKSGCSR